jgi:hypothetical protein
MSDTPDATFLVQLPFYSTVINGGVAPSGYNQLMSLRGAVGPTGEILLVSPYSVNVYVGQTSLMDVSEILYSEIEQGASILILSFITSASSTSSGSILQLSAGTYPTVGSWTYSSSALTLSGTINLNSLGYNLTFTCSVSNGVVTEVTQLQGRATDNSILQIQLQGIVNTNLSSLQVGELFTTNFALLVTKLSNIQGNFTACSQGCASTPGCC